MIWNRPCSTPFAASVVNSRRPAAALRLISASSPGSWIGTSPAFRPLDLLGVDVDADDVVAGLGEAGAGDEAHVAGAEDGYAHLCAKAWRTSGGPRAYV